MLPTLFIRFRNNLLLFGLTLVFQLLFNTSCQAWVYPEHRLLSLMAIEKLSPAFRTELDRYWQMIREGNADRLSVSIIDKEQGRKPSQLDWAAWPAIAGDHSCSPTELLNTVLKSKWILDVADAGAELAQGIGKDRSESQQINAIHLSDLKLLRVDEAYASRAGANNIHFLLPRSSSDINADQYFKDAMASKAPMNALGAYSWYHTLALRLANAYQNTSGENQQQLLLTSFACEAFAMHFLQDAFAAGHTTGSWGGAAVQKGTHDYYNKAGIEIQTWDAKRMVIKGDAYLDSSNADFISGVLVKSIEQLLTALQSPIAFDLEAPALPDSVFSYSICNNRFFPSIGSNDEQSHNLLMQTPIPGLDKGAGLIPRFRSEIGPFIGISASLNGKMLSGGFGMEQTYRGYMAGLEANIRFGIGLDGVLNQSGDGLMFVQFGVKQESASTNNFEYSNASLISNSITSAISSRASYNVRIRMPFFAIPGDLLLVGPVLALVSPSTLKKMAITSVNGGWIPWQSGIATRIGRFQIIAGRELGISFYGVRNPKDFLIIPTTPFTTAIVEYRSTRFDLPLLEYRPFKRFSEDQASSIMMQLNTGIDIPHHTETISPAGTPVPPMKNIWYIGMRIIFNWRQYL